jgi:hypothetical protein
MACWLYEYCGIKRAFQLGCRVGHGKENQVYDCGDGVLDNWGDMVGTIDMDGYIVEGPCG